MKSLPLACIVAAITLTGCSREDSAKQPAPVGFIAVVGVGEGDPLWEVLAATASRHVHAGKRIPIRIEAPSLVSSNAQTLLIRRLEEEGMRALCVQVVDVDASRLLLESLRRRGVVVVTMVDEVPVSPPFHHCGWDERGLGQQMTRSLDAALYDQETGATSESKVGVKEIAIIAPTVMIASMTPGENTGKLSPGVRRYRAFRDTLRKRRGIVVLEEARYDDPSELPATILRIAERFPTLDGWVLADGWSAGDVPEEVVDALGDRVVITAHALPSVFPLTKTEARVTAVRADYGSVAPHALDQALAMLRGGMSSRRKAEIDLAVVTADGWPSYQEKLTEWLTPKPPEDSP